MLVFFYDGLWMVGWTWHSLFGFSLVGYVVGVMNTYFRVLVRLGPNLSFTTIVNMCS